MRTIKKRNAFSRQQRVFFREWRKFRRLSQERAAERLDISHASLSRIERGLQRYHESLIDRMAEAYNCDPVDLLIRDPLDPEGLWSIWGQIPAPKRAEALAVLQVLKGTGTGD